MNDSQDNITVEAEAPDMVNHPPHYTDGPTMRSLECIDITRWMPFTLGNAFKYVWRAGKKGDACKAIEDLRKAEFYLNEFGTLYDAGFGTNLYPKTSQAVVHVLIGKVDIFSCDTMETWRRAALNGIIDSDWDEAIYAVLQGIKYYTSVDQEDAP